MNSLFVTRDAAEKTEGRWSGRNPLAVIWERRMWFAGVFATVFALAIIALVTLPSRYFTSGSLIVAEPESGLSLPPAGWAQKVGDPADIESQLLVIRSSRLMRAVLDRPGVIAMIREECARSRNPLTALFSSSSCHELAADSPAAIDYLLGRYSVSGAGRSRVITIGYTSGQPAVAQNMANALINAFLQDHREGISDGRAIALKGLTEEIERMDREIQSDDGKIQAFRSTKGLTNGATAPITSERLSSINAQLALAETSRSQAASIIAAVRDGGTGAAATLPAVLESRTVADVKQRLAALNEQAGAAAIALGPRHPRLRALQGQISALEASLDREVGNVVASARKQFDAAERTVTSLKNEMSAAKVEASSASRDETSIEQMVRDLGVKRSQYASLFDQRKKLESEQKALIGSTRLVSLAELPEKRFFPKTTPFVAGGFVLALIAATVAALLRGHLAGGKDADDPVDPDSPLFLARLPFVEKGRSLLDKLKAGDQEPAMPTALSRLHSALLHQTGGPPCTIAVLSAFAGEGKTFTALALARLSADSGRRVLVVEADMRRPQLADMFGVKPRTTLVDILAGNAAPSNAVIRTDVPRLDLIVSGDAGETCPTEFLTDERFIDFLAWARDYDLVLIDGPALDRQMDAGILACRTDGFLFCLRGGDDQATAMTDVTRRLSNLGARSLGFVLVPEAAGAQAARPQPLKTVAGGQ